MVKLEAVLSAADGATAMANTANVFLASFVLILLCVRKWEIWSEVRPLRQLSRKVMYTITVE